MDLFGLDTGPSPVHNAALPPNASAPSIPSLAAAQPTPAAPPPSNGQLLMEAAKEASPAATTGGGPKSNTDIMALFDSFVSPPAAPAAPAAAQPPQPPASMSMSMGGGRQPAFGQPQPAFGQVPPQSQTAFGHHQPHAAFGQQPQMGGLGSMGGLGGSSMFPSPTQPQAQAGGGGFPNLMSGGGGFPPQQPQPAFGGQGTGGFPAQFPPMTAQPPPPGRQNAFASLTPQLAGLNFGGSQPANPTPAAQPSSFAANLWN
mgnify:CR=1 FL=1